MISFTLSLDFVKVFPCVGDAAAYLKAVCAPMSHIKFLAVGGVNENNIKYSGDYFKLYFE